jgi:DNA-binding transcriptional LysR family regulator
VSDVTLIGLRVVHEVMSTGSFTAAAESLGYTQSAVSRQVALMERASAARLFERGPRGVEPTQAGAILAERAAEILADLDGAMRRIASAADDVTGRISIGAFPTAAAVLVPSVVARLAHDHPGLDVAVIEAATPTLLQRLRSGGIDAAVVSVGHGLDDHDLSGLREELIVHNDLRVAVSSGHRLSRRSTVDVDDLANEDWIVGTGRRGTPQFGAWPTLTSPHVVRTVESWTSRLGMVAVGLGVCVVPGIAAAMVPAGVTVLRVDDPHWLGRSTVVVTGSERSAAVEIAVAALRRWGDTDTDTEA